MTSDISTIAPAGIASQRFSPGRPGRRRRPRSSYLRRDARSGYWFVLPAAFVMGMLIIYPLLYGFAISLFDTNLVNRWEFVGLEYFGRALTDPVFLKSISTTIFYSAFTVLGTMVLGTIFALLLNMKIRFRTFFRVVLILPWLIPEVVVALVWKWMFNPLYGVLTSGLAATGLPIEPIQWLEDPSTALSAVIMASIWKGYPLVMILILAGLQSIPNDLYEAGSLDGANRLHLFRHVTLPALAPVLLVTVILETVWWFKHFTIVWLMTSGGPVDATNVVSISIYRTAFQNFQWGQAAAFATIVFAIVLAASIVYRRVIRDNN